jgi:hypothetical protein
LKNGQPLLTIVIPTVNRLALLKRAISSALAQTVPVEIIISDNGSTDGTDTYLHALPVAENMKRFRHAQTIPVQQHAAFLLPQVETEWLVFLSDDDSLAPEFSARVIQAVKARPEVALVYTGCDLHFANVTVPATIGPEFESSSDFFFEFMDGKRNICMCATAFRVSDLRAIGPQPADILIGDMYYWTRVLANGGAIGCVDAHLADYYFYQPGMRTETNSNKVLAWASESRELASFMCDRILADPTSGRSPAQVERVRRKFLALTASNQFAWNALRGASRIGLLKSFAVLLPTVFGDWTAPARAVGALVLPRSLLEWRILAHARRLSRRSVAAEAPDNKPQRPTELP